MATIARTDAVLDEAHVGDIRGALGTIRLDDHAPRATMSAKLKTLLAVVGPGLIVMCGDNDAGAFQTYGQAGQNYGTHLLWTLLLLVPVLYVNQEMVLRLGAVTGVGHARLIIERFGKFWGAFEVIDLFLLNALTIVTEFIGITLAAGYLGVPRVLAVALAAVVILSAAFTGSFRRFERIAVTFCVGSLLLIPLYFLLHPSAGQMAHGFTTPSLPAHGSNGMAAVMLLVIGIVGTTIAPWQLFFQQSYVVDKRITPRFMRYEKVDLWIGIVIVVLGAAALMGVTAVAFAGTKGFGNFTDASGLAHGIAAHAGRLAGVVFAVALLDAAIIGAFAVSLSSAYAIGDVLGMNHSLHRGFKHAKGFYAIYAALICGAATIVLIPGSPLGLLTEGVQVLAGVLLLGRDCVPAAAVQRPFGARSVGQPRPHERVRGKCGRRADHVVGGAHRLGTGSVDHRPPDRADHGHLRRGRGPGRRDRAGPGAPLPRAAHRGRGGVRGPEQLADAAAEHAEQAADVTRPQDRADRAALLPGRRDDPGRGEDRRGSDRALSPFIHNYRWCLPRERLRRRRAGSRSA